MTKYPVFALSGVPGAGKSRAALALAARLGARYIPFDDFETVTAREPDAVADWLARGAPWAEMYDPALNNVLASEAAAGPVVFETPMGRLPPAHAEHITCAIWIDTPRDVALARKLSAALAPRDWADADELAGWITGFLASYETLVRPCLEMQQARVMVLSDHTVDGLQPPGVVDEKVAEIARQVMSGSVSPANEDAPRAGADGVLT